MASSYHMSIEEIQYLAVASLATAAAFTAYSGTLTPVNSLLWLLASITVLVTRELGQRTLAEWIDAYVDVELSLKGASTSLIGAIAAVITGLPILLLFPVENSFSGKRYEHWGKSIDVIWMKRQYWIVMGGVIALFIGWLASLNLGLSRLPEAFILFLFFQLLPFDQENIPTGTLDGAYVLRWSGFIWLLLMAATLLGLVFTL